MNKNLLIILTVLLTSGCTLAPKYKTPDLPVTQNWGEGNLYADQKDFEHQQLELANFIKNEKIAAVIDLALSGNRDLRSRIADVEAARALYRVERAKLLPNIYAGGDAGQSKLTSGAHQETYDAQIGLSAFEVDLFGKNRSLTDSKLQQYLASEAAMESSTISLVAETANAWLTLAADKQLLTIAENTVKSAEKSADIAKQRFESGVTSKLDLYQAQTIYQQAKADVANYTAIVAQDINALELLAGQPVPAEFLPDGLTLKEEWLGDISSGLSSEILLRRPDIKAAEHTLRSANADIGAARAALFPSISLTGAAGFASADLSKLFSDGSEVWSYNGNINLPIFSGGKNLANLKYAKAKYQSYVAQYDKAIQTAFKEVKNALARRGTIYQQLDAHKELVNVSKQGYDLAEMRYSKGVETYLNVLQSQRTFYDAEKAFVNTILTELSNRIALYKSLGGGERQNAQTSK